MENQADQIVQKKCRKNERGAAMVMVLMISFLLIVAATSLLLESSMNALNVTDATAEEQAYYAAESGIQSVINVMRGNTVPNPLIDSTKPATDPVNKIDYFKATKLSLSNSPGDTSTEPRLSRWLPYDTTHPDRIVLGGTTSTTTSYSLLNGFAYKIKVENPDNVGDIVTYNTSGKIDGAGSKTWTDGGGNLKIEYESTSTTLDVSSGQANNVDFGKFIITGAGSIPTRVRFFINVNMTYPYSSTKLIRGWIEAGTVTNSDVGTVRIFYDSQVYIIMGSTTTLSNGTIVQETQPIADGTIRSGYEVKPNAPNTNLGVTLVGGNGTTMTAPEPIRLLIRSTGFGPRGAQKQLEAVIQKNYFNGLSAPSPLTLIGPPSTTSPTTNFVFNPGTSTGTIYNGKDVLLNAFLPPIGVTDDANMNDVNSAITKPPPNKFNGKVFGTVSNVTDEMPFWLQSATNLAATLENLKQVALASGRYYGPGTPVPGSGDYGNNANATGITFIDQNLEFSQSGGGILVVTGGLTFKGGFNFNGLIIVTGQNGISRTGGGSGILQGNMIVAPYLPNNLSKGFLSPVYDISGGGSSEIVYNSNNVANGLGALSNFVKGVAEK
jgi:hypothetical protein